jgi:hypothetical protein
MQFFFLNGPQMSPAMRQAAPCAAHYGRVLIVGVLLCTLSASSCFCTSAVAMGPARSLAREVSLRLRDARLGPSVARNWGAGAAENELQRGWHGGLALIPLPHRYTARGCGVRHGGKTRAARKVSSVCREICARNWC